MTERTYKLYKEVTERTDRREPTSLNSVGTGDQDSNVTSMDQQSTGEPHKDKCSH